MKKAVVLGTVVLLVAFGLVHWLRVKSPPEESELAPPTLDAQARDEVTRFWSTFQEATQVRISGNYQRAAELYQEALELDSQHEESLYYLGNCFFEMGNFGGARQAYRRLLDVEPNSARGLSGLGMVLSTPIPGNELDLQAARQAFQRVSEINPEHSGPFLRLGELALEQGDLEMALRYYQTAAGFRSPEGIFLSGMVLFRLGRFQQAREQFERVLEQQAHEEAIAGRGASSEGDTRVIPGKSRLSPLQAAAVKSRFYLTWVELASGGTPTAGYSRLAQRPMFRQRIETVVRRSSNGAGQERWQDFGGLSFLNQAVSDHRLVEIPNSLNFPGRAIRVARGDYDGDDREDLFLIRWKAPGMLWKNLGGGNFENVTTAVGLEGLGEGSHDAFFFDYDRDGKEDLFLAGHSDHVAALQHLMEPRESTRQATPRLFRNEGSSFREVTGVANLDHPYATLQAFAADLNRDSWTDLILVNGGLSPEILLPATVLLNRQGRFEEFTWLPDIFVRAPVEGAAVGDFDSDGIVEIYLQGIGLYRLSE